MNLAILLATYNSSAYLKEQLESLFNQTYSDFTLYIRDDGSNDSTLEIISRYQKNYTNIILLSDPIAGRGAMGSFMWLLENVNADYYMFCDHDDVWLPEKIETSITKIKEIESCNKPAVVCSDLCVVDKNLNVINKSMWSLMRQRPDMLIKKRFAVSTNIFTGCTMIINDAAKQISLPLSSLALMHDRWVGLRVLAEGGKIGYIMEPQILYRQHDNNVCGVSIIGGGRYIVSKIKGVKNLFSEWIDSYCMSKEAYKGKLSFWYFIFWKFIYLIKR